MKHTASFSLLEVMVAAALLAVAIFTIMAAIGISGSLRRNSHETDAVRLFLEEKVEVYRSLTVPAAQAKAVNEAGPVSIAAQYALPAGASFTTQILSEAESDAAFGRTLDLDQDGTSSEGTANSATTLYRILPLEIVVSWTSENRTNRTMAMTTVIYPKDTN